MFREFEIYSHPDLGVQSAAGAGAELVVLGNIYDPRKPHFTNAEIAAELAAAAVSLDSLFSASKAYCGRYVIIAGVGKTVVVFHDARGLREVYFPTAPNLVVCASQPHVAAQFSAPPLHLTTAPDTLRFRNEEMINMQWVGQRTCFDGICHLLPGTYLDLTNLRVSRYWPDHAVSEVSLATAVEKAVAYLQGALKAMVARHPCMLAVTAGIDSRVLLAASRPLREDLYYFVNQERGLSEASADIAIPKQIFSRLALRFHVHQVPDDPVPAEFATLFRNNVFFASDRIIKTVYHVYFRTLSNRVNILGLGEVGRTRYGAMPRELSAFHLAYHLGYKDSRYAREQLGEWFTEIAPIAKRFGLNVMSLLYLEQRAGNWGAVGDAESDIAMEEVDPFNSHELIELFYNVSPQFTQYRGSILYREMIRQMWPEVLDFPINPPDNARERMATLLKKVGVYPALQSAKLRMHQALSRS